jgi:PhoPQ-activated pathogenicity-related protein
MKTRQPLIDAFHQAMANEQRLYEKVKGHGPGMQGFNPREWQQWLDAVARTTAASKVLRESFADPGPHGSLT